MGSEWWGESGSRRKSRQPERRQKDELEWERKGRSRGIYIRVYICRVRNGRASDALLKEENGERTVPLEYTGHSSLCRVIYSFN